MINFLFKNNLIIIIILINSYYLYGEDVLITSDYIRSENNINYKSNINLFIESEKDIYGIRFDLKLNLNDIYLNDSDINLKISNSKIYTNTNNNGLIQIVILSIDGEKIINATESKQIELVNMLFTPALKFAGKSQVELLNLTIAGFSGIELKYNLNNYIYELSFISPLVTLLSQNHPNPFKKSTMIDYQISDSGFVSLIIYNSDDILIDILINEYQDINYYSINWDGLDRNDESVNSGTYILQMIAPQFYETITMTILK